MLSFTAFSNKIVSDLNKCFSGVILEGNSLVINSGSAGMSVPISSMYSEYQRLNNYKRTLKIYVDIIHNILNQYDFKIDYNNVYPMLKSKDFGNAEKHLGFYREPAFADIDIFYVSDEAETFRFVLNNDDVDFDKMKKAAWKNLNKLTNILVQLDDTLDIYHMKYSTDYNASFLLSDSIQKQILKKVGQDYIFAIPSSTTLLVARYHTEYLKIINRFIMADKDPNKISDKIYQFKNGVFNIVTD